MPVFKGGRTVSGAIESICRQTFMGGELLVLDDGSDDDSLEIARLAAASDDRFKPIPLEHTGLIDTLSLWSRFRVVALAHDYRKAVDLFVRAAWTRPPSVVMRSLSSLKRGVR